MATDRYIELYSGTRWYPEGGTHKWNVEDIAHSLGNQCRYTGHCRHFYSVAEHSVLCSLLAEEVGYCDPFEALMHDAHESMVGDRASPMKAYTPDFTRFEKVAESDMRAAYGLPADITQGCKRIDYLALFIEAYFLMKSKGEGWVDTLECRVEALKLIRRGGWRVTGLDPAQAKNAFLLRFNELAATRNTGEQWWEHQDAAAKEQSDE